MNAVNTGFLLNGLLAAVILLFSQLYPSPAAYAALLLTVLFITVFLVTRSWDDRAVYLALAGTLLVAVFSAASVWGGLAAAWMIALIIASVMDIRLTRASAKSLAIAACATVGVTLFIDSQNHVPVPLMVVCSAAFLILAAIAVRKYRFRKHYCGGAA
ncbi:MAG TPA: hypothetical protein HA272_03990 [Methanoregula sp.]|nr:hypothetical protein [Methanoregula sp.]